MNYKIISIGIIVVLLISIIYYLSSAEYIPSLDNPTKAGTANQHQFEPKNKSMEHLANRKALNKHKSRESDIAITHQVTETPTTHTEKLQDIVLDSYVRTDKEHTVFDSSVIDNLSLEKTREALYNLSNNLLDVRSQVVFEEFSNGLHEDLIQSNSLALDIAQCSDKVCGVLFSSIDQAELNTALESIVGKPYIKRHLRGGTMKVFEQDGEYFGLILGVIGNQPIKIK